MEFLSAPNLKTLELHAVLRQGMRQAGQYGRPIVVSLSEAISPFDAITLFERAPALTPDRYFWAHPEEGFALVGVGVARAIDVAEHLRFRQATNSWRHLLVGAILAGPRHLPGVGPVLLGGFAFDTQRPNTPLWQGYPAGHLVLPRLLFTQTQGEHWLTYNVIVDSLTDVADEVEALEDARHSLLAPTLTRPHKNGSSGNGNGNGNGHGHHEQHFTQHELRSAADWQKDVAEAATAVRAEKLEKVVLARAVQLRAAHHFNPAHALRHLATRYTGCYLFAVARGERCFLGATPERLAQLAGGQVRTMSLAGSIRRGKTTEDDLRLGQTLLTSAKDLIEHRLVVQTMTEALSEICIDLRLTEPPTLLKLGNIQHLCTPITGKLLAGYTLLDLVERLHPTPAVGGRPREAALRLIRDCENLDRGWYAGPVGWLNEHGEGEFAVALRSALLHGAQATLFAGCGIVADSDPKREYDESRLKLKPMLAALAE